MIRKKSNSGQTLVEYAVLMVVLAIAMITTVFVFRDALKGVIKKAAQSQSQRGQQAPNLPQKGSYSSTSKQAKSLPHWKDNYVPKDTVWKHEHNPEKPKKMEDRYEPAKTSGNQ